MTGLDVENDKILQARGRRPGSPRLRGPTAAAAAATAACCLPPAADTCHLPACLPAQIAVICTDGSLEVQAEGPEIAIHQPEEVLQVRTASLLRRPGAGCGASKLLARIE